MEIEKIHRQTSQCYVRRFSGAKVKCMKDYMNPCLREKKSGLPNSPCWNK